MYRTTLGDFELTILSDGIYRMDGGAMFGVVPKPMWEKRIPADERNTIPLAMNSLLVRTGEQNILIETGMGNKLNDKARPSIRTSRNCWRTSQEPGSRPDEIDIVINTHLHFDHCGWNTVYPDGKRYRPFRGRVITCRKVNGSTPASSTSAIASAT